jgi:hypothetical protein
VEETLNALLDAEADRLCNAQRYERSEARLELLSRHRACQRFELPQMAFDGQCERARPKGYEANVARDAIVSSAKA